MLGAARIGAPGLIIPARSHPEVVVHAVAARDLSRAQAYAKKHGIKKAYEGYQGIASRDWLCFGWMLKREGDCSAFGRPRGRCGV